MSKVFTVHRDSAKSVNIVRFPDGTKVTVTDEELRTVSYYNGEYDIKRLANQKILEERRVRQSHPLYLGDLSDSED